MTSVESRLAPGEVHLWQIHLLGSDEEIVWGRSVLSADEIQRADRYYFERHRRSFIVARSALRKILSTYLNVLPRDIAFSYGEKGKPNLAPGLAGSGLNFNLSHSGDYALLAVTQQSCLGVDIEFIDHERTSEEIAARFFSPGEVDTLRAVPLAERAEAFFSCWTRKEAYIKAVGDGLSIPLDSFDVAFGPGVEPALLRVHAPPYEGWRMYDILSPPGYAAALVIEGEKHELRYLLYE
jgi:4'-phosphopantetheinyl transferase